MSSPFSFSPIPVQGRRRQLSKQAFRSLCCSFGLRSFSHMVRPFVEQGRRKGRPSAATVDEQGRRLPLANCLLSSVLIIPPSESWSSGPAFLGYAAFPSLFFLFPVFSSSIGQSFFPGDEWAFFLFPLLSLPVFLCV